MEGLFKRMINPFVAEPNQCVTEGALSGEQKEIASIAACIGCIGSVKSTFVNLPVLYYRSLHPLPTIIICYYWDTIGLPLRRIP